MKKIRIAELLSTIAVAGITITLTSCGGGNSGNGVSQSGFYQFSIQGAPKNAVYSVDPSTLSIPLDMWQFTATFNSDSGTSSSSAIITSASLCVEEPGLSISCMPVSFANPVILNGNEAISTEQFNFYKFGQFALQANPYQDLQVANTNVQVPAFVSPSSAQTSYVQGSSSIVYAPSFYLNNNIVPGTLNIFFNYSLPATVIVSSTTISNTNTDSSTAGAIIVTSSTTTAGIYNISGICSDDGNGNLITTSSDTGIVCSGSVQYANGYVTNFSISQAQSASISLTSSMTSTISSSSMDTSNSSSTTGAYTVTTVTTYIVQANASASATPRLTAAYLYSSSALSPSDLSSSVISAYIPSATTFSQTSGLYTETIPTAQGVSVVIPASSGGSTNSQTVYFPCSQIQCSINDNIFSATLPINITPSYTTNVDVQNITYYTYNPNIFISTYTPVVAIPYTVTATIDVDGSTMTATYNGTFAVQAP